MPTLFWTALITQAVVMTFDEYFFHFKRNLGVWERWGHPVDTVCFLLPLSILAFFQPSESATRLYIVLSVASCLVITKDEWVHGQEARAGEQWVHSLLFMLHPVILIAGHESRALVPQMHFQWIWFSILSFFFYQLIFWNFYADRILEKRLHHHQQ